MNNARSILGVVGIAGLGVVTACSGGGADVPPVEVATDFLEAAYDEHDLEAAEQYLTEDSTFVSYFATSTEDWQNLIRWYEAVDFQLLLDACEETGTSEAGVEVTCPYSYHFLRSDQLGRGPFTGNTFEVTVRDGAVARVKDDLEYDANESRDTMWNPFTFWLKENHWDDSVLMLKDYPPTTDEGNALWTQYNEEWVAEVLASDEAQ